MTTDPPPGWEMACLGDLCTPRVGKVVPAEDDPRPYLSLDNIAGEVGRIERWEGASGYRSQSVELSPGDVAYARLRPYLNKVAVADREALGSAELIVLPPSDALMPEFLQYQLLSSRFVKFAQEESTGDRPRLKWRQMRHYALAVPPSVEQQRIVAAIGEHFSRFDTVERALVSARSKAMILRVAHISSAMQGWPMVCLGDVSEVFVGATPSRRDSALWGGTVPWVSSGEIQFCRIGDTRESVSTAAVRPERIHPPGTVLLAMIGEGRTRGQAAILEIAAAHNQNSAAIRTDRSKLNPEWLFCVLSAQYESNRRIGSGNNQPALNKTRVQGLRVPVPPMDEQYGLVSRLEEVATSLDQINVGLEAARQRLSALRRGVLAAAFSGQLVQRHSSMQAASIRSGQVRALSEHLRTQYQAEA